MSAGDKRTVLFFQESWGRGGIETFVMNVIRTLDPMKYSFEVWSAYDWDDGYDDELERRGVRRVAVFPGCTPSLIMRLREGIRAWDERLALGDVDIVHVNAMNGVTLAYVEVARRRGVPVRVAHSHNDDFGGGSRAVKSVFHRAGRALWADSATAWLACSHSAGKHLFGDRQFEFVSNGIDTERFRFDPDARHEVRESFGIPESVLVVGSVGRISHQKNPLFSVRVLAELVAGGNNARLLLVGDGELEGETMILAERLGVADLYVHIPSVPDPERHYSALDVFLMPSLYEGFGYSLLEAQCSGLPCIVSEAIQDEACVTDLVQRLTLKESAGAWANHICNNIAIPNNRPSYADVIDRANLSLDASVKQVESKWQRL